MPLAAIILAAGASSRFGRPKQLVAFEGEALVRRATRAALEAGCTPVVVVVGAQRAAIQRELHDLSADVVMNDRWEEGLASSIRCGLERVRQSDAVLLAACDQPFLSGEVLRRLVAIHRVTGRSITASAYAETLGIPAIFDCVVFPELLQLAGDEGAKRVILSEPGRVAAFAFDDGEVDIDTPHDYAQLTERT